MPTDNTSNTSIMIVLGSILLLSLIYLFSGQPIHNEGSLQLKERRSNGARAVVSDEESEDSENDNSSAVDSELDSNDSVSQDQSDIDDSVDSSLEVIRERAMGQNGPYYRRTHDGRYKHNSYRALGQDEDRRETNKYFKVPDVSKNYTDRFVPVDESAADAAPIDIANIKGNDRDRYNSNAYLPQEKEKDWFETIETTDVKNSHLINIYRPIGADTIGSTHKGAIYDIRGIDKAVCPKFVVSPWLQSSWEPDRSSKSLCN